MLRTHDVVLVGGTFRVVLTPKRRVVAVLDVETSPLGPLHIALDVDRSRRLDPAVSPAFLNDPGYMNYGPIVSRAVFDASAKTFDAASYVARTIAPPTLTLARNAASEAAELALRNASPSRAHHHASHLLMRFRLGDLNAKRLIQKIVHDAKAGIHTAMRAADTLKDASKFVANVVDVPVSLAAQYGGNGSPLAEFHNVLGAVKTGDFHQVAKLVNSHLGEIEGALAQVPGIGTGLSAGISAGLAALEGGHPIEVAVKAAYAAIPIPASVRHVTDIALDTVVAFIEHPHNLTDVALQVARDRLPLGIPRDVFDTLAHVLVKHVPVQQAALSLASHYVQKYAPTVGGQALNDAVSRLGLDPSLVHRAASNVVHLDIPREIASYLPRSA